jgi:hypothetical protein
LRFTEVFDTDAIVDAASLMPRWMSN